jgi:hypothetical protein
LGFFGFHKRNSALRSMAFCVSAGVGFVSSANAACPIGLNSKKQGEHFAESYLKPIAQPSLRPLAAGVGDEVNEFGFVLK